MTQAEYWADYEVTQNEVATAIESFYAHLELNNYASEDPAVLRGFSDAASFWITTRYSLITTFFITLGRLFDEDGDAHSIHKLLKATGAHPEYFSRDALAERKRLASGGGVEPDRLADYLKNAWEPDAASLRELRRALIPYTKKYQAFYEPIRHKVFAHKALKDTASVDALFCKAIIHDIEEVLNALHDLLAVIWQLYHNGIKPEFGSKQYGYNARITRVKTTTRRALARVRQDEVAQSAF
jgi:AbiU2